MNRFIADEARDVHFLGRHDYRDPRGNERLTRKQLSFPGTPKEYKEGYLAGAEERRAAG